MREFGKDSIPEKLTRAHYEEVAEFKGTLKLNPDWNEYERLQYMGHLAFIAAHTKLQSGEWQMIGYAIFIVKPHLHYKATIVASDDLHYIMPAWRRLGVGTEILRYAEGVVREMGADFVSVRTKIAHDHGELFTKMGYKAVDTLYLKEFDRA